MSFLKAFFMLAALAVSGLVNAATINIEIYDVKNAFIDSSLGGRHAYSDNDSGTLNNDVIVDKADNHSFFSVKNVSLGGNEKNSYISFLDTDLYGMSTFNLIISGFKTPILYGMANIGGIIITDVDMSPVPINSMVWLFIFATLSLLAFDRSKKKVSLVA